MALIEETFHFTRMTEDMLLLPIPDVVLYASNLAIGEVKLVRHQNVGTVVLGGNFHGRAAWAGKELIAARVNNGYIVRVLIAATITPAPSTR